MFISLKLAPFLIRFFFSFFPGNPQFVDSIIQDEERFLNRYFKGGNCDLLGKDPFNNLT